MSPWMEAGYLETDRGILGNSRDMPYLYYTDGELSKSKHHGGFFENGQMAIDLGRNGDMRNATSGNHTHMRILRGIE